MPTLAEQAKGHRLCARKLLEAAESIGAEDQRLMAIELAAKWIAMAERVESELQRMYGEPVPA